ncbi:MAG: hypothetical protein ACREIT_01405 [Tepidisphaeraceae bacterium]
MTRKSLNWCLCAALAMGGIAYAEDMGDKVERTDEAIDRAANDAGRDIDRTDDAARTAAARDTAATTRPSGALATLPEGITAKAADDAEDVRDLLATVTEAALTKDGFNDVVERFVDQDRNRIGEGDDDLDAAQLNAAVDKLAAVWKAKYNEDFEVDHRESLDQVAVIQGEVEDPTMALRHWPVAASMLVADRQTLNEAVPAARTEGPTPGTETPVEAANLEKGREVAIATFPASGKLPAINASIVGEVQAWRIDVPNHVSAAKLHQNLLTKLNKMSAMPADQWPADQNEAAAHVTHCVLMALYDVHADESGAMDKRMDPSDKPIDRAIDEMPQR